MAIQINTPDAGDAQYPAFTGFQTQDPRTISYADAAAQMPLVYGVQLNQIQCELLAIQAVVAAFSGVPWIVTADDAYVVSGSFLTGTRFYVTPATATTPSVTLPIASGQTAGNTLTLICGPSYAPNIYANAADTFKYVDLSGQSLILRPYNAVTFVTDGVDKWFIVAGIPDVIY